MGRDGEVIVEKNILGFLYDKKNHKTVIWTKNAIGIVEKIKPKKELGVLQDPWSVQWIFKQGQRISQAFWAHDGAYILFQDQSKVLMLELETFSAPSTYELLETKYQSHIFYSDESGELFYLDKKSGHLMSLEVIPKWKVLETPVDVYYCCLGVAKNSRSLTDWLNVALFDLHRSGFIDRSWEKRFGVKMFAATGVTPYF